MADLAFYIQSFVATILGYGFALMITFQLFFRFIRSPITFVKKTFFIKRDVMPACLNDPSLGQHNYVYLEEVKLHYVISGDEGKPLMLFVHGFPEFWYCWKYQIREFNKDYRTVAVDLRGYADSDKPSGIANYKINKMAADLQQLVSALGYESCTLVGHDWGGAVSWYFAYTYPEMVNKLIVMNAPHPHTFRKYLTTNHSQRKKSWYMMFFQVPLIPELTICAMDFEALEKMLKQLEQNPSPEDIEAYKYAFSSKGALQCPINYYRAAFQRPAEQPKVKKLNMETLIIWGDPDVALNTELAELAREYVSNLTVRVIKNSNHFVQTKSPTETNKHMREFLAAK